MTRSEWNIKSDRLVAEDLMTDKSVMSSLDCSRTTSVDSSSGIL